MAQKGFIFICLFFLILSGCASSTFKKRQEQREKMAASSGLFCQFISGDLHPDLDVELTMQMGRRCDSSKNFTITHHRNASDQDGVIFCCATAAKADRKSSVPAGEVQQ